LPVPGLEMSLERAARRGGDGERADGAGACGDRQRFGGGWSRFGVAWGPAEVSFCLSPFELVFGRSEVVAKPVASKCQAVRGQAEVGFCLSPFELVFGSGWLGDRQRPVFACPQCGLELDSRLWTRVGWCGSGPGEILARGRAEVRFCLVRGQAAVGFCLSPVRT